MAGQGKYTAYVPVASNRNSRLGQLFKGNETAENPFASTMDSGDNETARQETIARAEELLRPDKQTGDLQHFPDGVNMNYEGTQALDIPNLPDVKWESASDPANPYMPDPTSPGPGITDPKSRDTDPGISPTDVKGQGYVPGAPGTSTARNPADTAEPIRKTNKLGTSAPLGKNSDNEPSGFGS
jgi:hypothetical protein